MVSRLRLALESGAVSLPQGPLLAFRPQVDQIVDLGHDNILAVQGYYPQAQALERAGFATSPEVVPGAYAGALVFVDKSKAETLRLIAQAMAHLSPGAPVVVDGDKGAGVASVLKLCKAWFEVGPVFSKAHGKVFTLAARPAPPDWMPDAPQIGPYRTGSGVFSADGIDPGSALLIAALPPVSGRVLDMGAGWGYLSAAVLARGDAITAIDLVEAEWNAAQAARANVTDPRAAVHWADALAWEGRYDWVLSNPPFHQGRDTTPALGQAFIERAARLLAPGGHFVMVANRHLPYEGTLAHRFAEVTVARESGGYKVIIASRAKKGG